MITGETPGERTKCQKACQNETQIDPHPFGPLPGGKIHETEVSRVPPLAFLAPRIVEAILDGRQAEELTVKSLKRLGPLPSDWEAQQKLLRISG